MVDLDALEAAVLAEYRAVSAPSSAVADALFERVASTTALAAATATTAGATATTKLLIAFAVAAGLGGGGALLATSDEEPVATARPEAEPPTAPATVAESDPEPEPEVEPEKEVEPGPEVEPVPAAPVAARKPASPSTRSTPPPTSPQVQRPNPAASIAAQTRLIRRADDALRRGQLPQAMAALLQYEREFPDGVLGVEAEALDHIHACKSDLPGARNAAAEFVRQNPTGGLTDRVRRACADGEER
jgi:hypothetical protein